MIICGIYMFEFSVSKDIKLNNSVNMRIPTYIEAYLLTLIIKDMKISVQ